MHLPVLTEKVVEYLDPKSNENFIDGTIGGGGHAVAILEKNGPAGKVLGIDWDPEAIHALKRTIQTKYRKRLLLATGNFAHLKEIAKQKNFHPVHGIVLDLGLSSEQIEKSRRGFSFLRDEPLDMRYSPDNPTSAEKILNYWSRSDIERILKEYGEEQFAKEIARLIIRERSQKPIRKTSQLVLLVQEATPKWYHRQKIHPATKTFQALRIAVNDELQNIQSALEQTPDLLNQNGRVVVLSFHSLEDRMVKNFFQNHAQFSALTKKPISPSPKELKNNKRARSAKLRAARKM